MLNARHGKNGYARVARRKRVAEKQVDLRQEFEEFIQIIEKVEGLKMALRNTLHALKVITSERALTREECGTALDAMLELLKKHDRALTAIEEWKKLALEKEAECTVLAGRVLGEVRAEINSERLL